LGNGAPLFPEFPHNGLFQGRSPRVNPGRET
jgi:hypothetical protein